MTRSITKQMRTSRAAAAVIAAAALIASPSSIGHPAEEHGHAHKHGRARHVWSTNTAKQNILSGAPIVAKRIDSSSTTSYCDVASTPGTDFTWVDMSGSGLEYSHAWTLWAAPCPGAVAKMRGAEVIYTERGTKYTQYTTKADAPPLGQRELTEKEIQKATDGGAVVLIIPVDTAAQARQAVRRAYYPPFGTRGLGPGQFDAIYGDVTTDYRGTYNDNLVMIAMVSTVEGASNAAEIARVRGVHALFLDAMNLESSSGYPQGSPDYEKLAQAIRAGAQAGQRHLCTADRSTTPHTLTCVRHPTGKP